MKPEITFNKPLKEVILEHLNKNNLAFGRNRDLLGTERQQLRQWIEKLGIKHILFYIGSDEMTAEFDNATIKVWFTTKGVSRNFENVTKL